MSNVLLWRPRARMSNAAPVMAPTDAEFRMFMDMFRSHEANMAQRFQSLTDRLDKYDDAIVKNRDAFSEGLKETNQAVHKLSEDWAAAKASVGVWRWIAGFLGLGTVVAAAKTISGHH